MLLYPLELPGISGLSQKGILSSFKQRTAYSDRTWYDNYTNLRSPTGIYPKASIIPSLYKNFKFIQTAWNGGNADSKNISIKAELN